MQLSFLGIRYFTAVRQVLQGLFAVEQRAKGDGGHHYGIIKSWSFARGKMYIVK